MTIKAVTSSIGLILLLTTTGMLRAQTPADVAEEEAVRRQEAIQLLHMKLGDAQALQKSFRFIEAAKMYEDAWSLFPRVGLAGGFVEEDKRAVVAGLVETRLKLADDARRRGDLNEADAQLKRAQKVDPRNPVVMEMKLENDRAIAASRGNVPSQEALSKIPEFQNERIKIGTTVQDGKLLFEMGKLNEAEAKLRQALAEDPTNKGAKYYLDLIKEQRFSREVSKREASARDALVEVEKAWNPPVKRDLLPFPNQVVRNQNQVNTSPQRQEIMAKLNQIRLNEVGYDGLPLSEVLKHLTDESIKRDPDKIGLNFMINPHSDAPAALAPAAPTDPSAPPVALEATIPAIDLATVTVKISPPLRNLRMADVLDAIITAADQPVRYELRDYAIVFSPRTPEPIQLYTRQFKVDPNTFLQGLESVAAFSVGSTIGGGGGRGGGGGGGSQDDSGIFTVPRVLLGNVIRGQGGSAQSGVGSGINFVTKTNFTTTVNQMARDYFIATGVDLQPPKNVFFNDRNGILVVRATLQDLEIIEVAVQALNQAPPQVQIESKIAEIGQTDARALGFDWFLGNTLMFGGDVGGQGGSAPSFQGAPSTANPLGIFPGPGVTPAGSAFPTATDGLLTQGLRNAFGIDNTAIPELGTITGILTDPQFRLVVRAMEQRGGLDVLASPKVTTLSGRQAQISTLDLRTIVTSVDNQNTQLSTPVGGTGNVIQNNLPTFIPFTQPIPFGPVLDVIPYVSADGFSIQMTIIPTLSEFLGYEDPGNFAPVAATPGGQSLTAALPLPRIRIRQVTTSCVVYDGQTVVLGGLITENIRKIKDKVPMLGDIPYVGRLFRSESNFSDKRNLVIFVTPTIIDPAGNRVHRDEELPFARNTIPQQGALSQ